MANLEKDLKNLPSIIFKSNFHLPNPAPPLFHRMMEVQQEAPT